MALVGVVPVPVGSGFFVCGFIVRGFLCAVNRPKGGFMPFCIDEAQQYLTPKEARVLLEIASGKTRKQIARLFCRGESTIKSHTVHIAEKLGSKNAANMIMVALEKGVIRLLSLMLVCVIAFNCVMPSLDDVSIRRGPRGVRVSRTASRTRVERLGSAFG